MTDPVPNARSTEDVDNQAANNYGYDEVGNLVRDTQAGVGAIAWTPYGKIARVTRNPLSTGGGQPFTAYAYDAQGNRMSKATGVAGVPTATTYYVRDAQGTPLAVYERLPPAGSPASLRLREQALYGSARLDLRQPNLTIVPGQNLPAATGYYARVLGQKRYELTHHLGNVRAVVTDEKTSALGTGGTPLASSLLPVLSADYNYYPFGQLQPDRYGPANTTANSGYRYGYNGKEKDNNGELGLTTYNYGFRIYNPGLGRFLSVDPLTKSYPWYTPYQFAGNKPIAFVDLDGLGELYYFDSEKAKYSGFSDALKVLNTSGILKELSNKFANDNQKVYIYINLTDYLFPTTNGRTQYYEKAYTLDEKTSTVYQMREDNPTLPQNKLQTIRNQTLIKNEGTVLITLQETLVKGAESDSKQLMELVLTVIHEIEAHALDYKDLKDDISTYQEHKLFYNDNSLTQYSPEYDKVKADSPAGTYKPRIEAAIKALNLPQKEKK